MQEGYSVSNISNTHASQWIVLNMYETMYSLVQVPLPCCYKYFYTFSKPEGAHCEIKYLFILLYIFLKMIFSSLNKAAYKEQ